MGSRMSCLLVPSIGHCFDITGTSKVTVMSSVSIVVEKRTKY